MSTNDFDDLEIETSEVLAEGYGINDNGDFIMHIDNGATDIEARVLAANMEVVVRTYLKRHPEWALEVRSHE